MNNYADCQELTVKIVHVPKLSITMVTSFMFSLFVYLNRTLPKGEILGSIFLEPEINGSLLFIEWGV